MTTYLFPFLLQKQIILLDFHLTEVSNNSRCKEYICKYLRNPHFCSISKIKRWGGEYCIKTYLATPRPLLCHLSGNATPSVMSLIWQRHALCYVTPDKSLLILCKNKMRHSYCTRHSCMSQNNCAVDHSPRIRGDFTIQKRNIVFIFIYRGTIPFRK
jgi:hypothetical protein